MSNSDLSKKRRKRVVLSLKIKLGILDKLDKGVSVDSIVKEYNIGKTTVSDLKKNKMQIRSAAVSSEIGFSSTRKTLKQPVNIKIDEAVLRWFLQQRSLGLSVCGAELKGAASRFAEQFGFSYFKASEGWLWCFRRRHGLKNVRVLQSDTLIPESDIISENLDETFEKPFRENLSSLISSSGLLFSQVYNANETELFWKLLKYSMEAPDQELCGPATGEAASKERVSALLCANADGSHRLTSVIVGKSKSPHPLKNCIDKLPVHYYSSSNAWLTPDIFKDWFFHHFIPEVREFQAGFLKIAERDIQALLLVDSNVHPGVEELCSDGGRLRCLVLPADSSPIVQPMDHCISDATKRLYNTRYLHQVLVTLDQQRDNHREEKTMMNIKNYNIKSAIYNWASAWEDVKVSTLADGWKTLLGSESRADYHGRAYVTADFQHFLSADGKEDWVPTDDAATSPVEERCSTDGTRTRLCEVKELIDGLMKFMDTTSDCDFESFYWPLWQLRELVIRKQLIRRRLVDGSTGPSSPRSSLH